MLNKTLLIDNCEIISYCNYAIGMGTKGGCLAEFRNCTFKSTANASFFMHDAPTEAETGVQNVKIVGCIFISVNSPTLIRIDSQVIDGSEFNLTFENNFLRSLSNPTSIQCAFINASTSVWVSNIDDLPNTHLTNESFNNNIESLNFGE